MTTKIYAIMNKETGDFHTFNSRCAWTKVGNAKNAFDIDRPTLDRHTFDSYYYKMYEIVELTEAFYRLKGLEK